MAVYPQNYWKLSTMKKLCKRVDQRGSATKHKAGSDRLKLHARTQILRVKELICSQEGQSSQHLTTHKISAELDISDRSVRRIAKKDVYCLNK